MITFNEALQIAENHLSRGGQTNEYVILSDETMEKSYGWIFFYTSRKLMETGDLRYVLAGNSPFLVDKKGKIHVTGSAYHIDHYVKILDERFKDVNWD